MTDDVMMINPLENMNNQKKFAFSILTLALKELMRKNEQDRLLFYNQALIEIKNATLNTVHSSPHFQDFQEMYETCQKALNNNNHENNKTQDEHRRLETELRETLNKKHTELCQLQDEHQQLKTEFQKSVSERIQNERRQLETELRKSLSEEIQNERQRLETEFQKALNDQISIKHLQLETELKNERERLETELQKPFSEQIQTERQRLKTDFQKALNEKISIERQQSEIELKNERQRLETELQNEHQQLQKTFNDQLSIERQQLQKTFNEQLLNEHQKIQKTYNEQLQKEHHQLQKALNEKHQELDQIQNERQQLQTKLKKALQNIDQKQNDNLSDERRIELEVPTFKFVKDTLKPQSLNEIIANINNAFDLNYSTQQIMTRATNLQNIMQNLQHIINKDEHTPQYIKMQVNDIIKNNEITPLALKVMESFRHRNEVITIYQAAYMNMLEYYTQLTKNKMPESVEKIEMWDKDLVRLFGEMAILTKRTRNLYDQVEKTIHKLEQANDIDTVNFREAYKDFLIKSTEHKMSINSIEHQLNQMHDRCIQRLAFNNKQYVEIKTLQTQIRTLNSKRNRLISERNVKLAKGTPIDKFYDTLVKYIEAIEKENVHLQTQLQVMGDELKRNHIDIKDNFDAETYNMIFPETPNSSMALKDELSASIRRYNSQIKKLKSQSAFTQHMKSENTKTTKKPVKRLNKSDATHRAIIPKFIIGPDESSTSSSETISVDHSYTIDKSPSETIDAGHSHTIASDDINQPKRKSQENDDEPSVTRFQAINSAKKSKITDSGISTVEYK